MPRAKSMSQAENHDQDLVLDPILWGLLERLPEAGSVWVKSDQQKWLTILGQTFDLIYKQPDAPQATTAPHAPRVNP